MVNKPYPSEPDMSQVDELAVQFACQGTRMKLNRDERIVAVRRMLGIQQPAEIARLICTFKEEIARISRATPGTLMCPFCRQIAYHDDEVLRQHIDQMGRRWCPQSGLHRSDRAPSMERLARK